MRVIGLLFLVAVSFASSASKAGMVLEVVPTGPYVSDGVSDFSGTFDVRVKEFTPPLGSTTSVTAVGLVVGFVSTNSAFQLGTTSSIGNLNISRPSNFVGQVNDENLNFSIGATYLNLNAIQTAFEPFTITAGQTVATVPFTVLGGQPGTFGITPSIDPISRLVVEFRFDQDLGELIRVEDPDVSIVGSISVVPEPASVTLIALAAGSGAFGAWRRNRRKKS